MASEITMELRQICTINRAGATIVLCLLFIYWVFRRLS